MSQLMTAFGKLVQLKE